jgi:hypothetical protein
MNKAKVIKLAEKLGAKIHDDDTSIGLEAPRFKTVSIGQHEYRYDVTDTRKGVWNDILEDLKQGFEDCDDHLNRNCDWCDEAEYK